MIESVEINNYRGLRDIKVRLSPLTVLIGPNNSGKTSFLRAIELAGVAQISQPFNIERCDHWQMDLNNAVTMQIGHRIVRTLISGLQSLSVSTPNAQTRRLDLVMEGGWEMPADNASSGVRLLLFFESPATIAVGVIGFMPGYDTALTALPSFRPIASSCPISGRRVDRLRWGTWRRGIRRGRCRGRGFHSPSRIRL